MFKRLISIVQAPQALWLLSIFSVTWSVPSSPVGPSYLTYGRAQWGGRCLKRSGRPLPINLYPEFANQALWTLDNTSPFQPFGAARSSRWMCEIVLIICYSWKIARRMWYNSQLLLQQLVRYYRYVLRCINRSHNSIYFNLYEYINTTLHGGRDTLREQITTNPQTRASFMQDISPCRSLL